MRSFTYDALAGRVVFGTGRFDDVPAEVTRLGGSRVLLIADRSGTSWADQLVARVGAVVVARIDDVRPHVPLDHAESARAMAMSARANLVVTLGGGSATGLGKAIALTTGLPILAVPTTYAGSEMTPIWGLTTDARKETGRDLRVQPRTVIYDPLLTLSLPPSISGPSGMNAVAHCAEAVYADAASPVTTAMALEGLRILSRHLPRVVRAPDDVAERSEVLAGAYLAAAAFAAAGSGIHHKICHVLGGAYDLPHAEMHTVILPHALALMAPIEPESLDLVAAALGGTDAAGCVYDLAVDIGAPTDLASIGMSADHLDEAAHLVAEALTGYDIADERTVRALLGDAYHGRRPSAASSPRPVSA